MTRRTAATMLSAVEMVAAAADPDSCLASRARHPISVHTGRPPVPATQHSCVIYNIYIYIYIYTCVIRYISISVSLHTL